MKASRAPGPISYSQLHQQKSNPGRGAEKQRPRAGRSNVDKACSANGKAGGGADGGKLIKYKNFDDIGELGDAWGELQLDNIDFQSSAAEASPYRIKSVHFDYNQGLAAPPLPAHSHAHSHAQGQREEDDWDEDEEQDEAENWGHSPAQHQQQQQYYSSQSNPTKAALLPQQSTGRRNDVDHYGEREPRRPHADMYANESDSEEDFETTPNQQRKDDHRSESKYPKTTQPAEKEKRAPQPKNAPPPLPCEPKVSQEGKALTEEEKLYYTKQPRAVEFKPYTLSQYKMIKPKEYVEISKMKPDLNTDELVAKRKNLDRIKEFSKQLRHYNQEVIMQQPKKPSAVEENDLSIARSKLESNRQRALEFAKNVPKPKVAAQTEEREVRRVSSSAEGKRNVEKDLYMDDEAVKEARLQELELKHAQNRAKMDAIRKSLATKY